MIAISSGTHTVRIPRSRIPTGGAALLLLFLATTPALAVRRPTLRFVQSADMADIGLKVKLMSQAEERPLPSLTLYTYKVTRGNETKTVDFYDPVEIWRGSQQAGHWADAFQTKLTLATVSTPLPRGFSRQHVPREEYDERAAATSAPAKEWSHEALSTWVADFAGATAARIE